MTERASSALAALHETVSLAEAEEFVLASLGRDLKAAREHAGLSQAQLAKRLGKTQTTVSKSEAGKIQVSEAYVRAVLKACKLPATWKAP